MTMLRSLRIGLRTGAAALGTLQQYLSAVWITNGPALASLTAVHLGAVLLMRMCMCICVCKSMYNASLGEATR